MELSPRNRDDFRDTVWQYYAHHHRAMPWRDDCSLYAVLVSELMLQQTQVSRVLPKFAEFMRRFPSIETLAEAPLSEVIVAWQGLGYNRRAKYLHEAAKLVVDQGASRTVDALIKLPGVGRNTAGAIMAYVYDEPVVFVETNIRTVYIHHFFADHHDIHDRDISNLVKQTLDHEHPREWYWALMDYGAYLKLTDNRLSQSRHYKKQSPLEGSVRQMRGHILDVLRRAPIDRHDTDDELQHDERFNAACEGLLRDGLIVMTSTKITLSGYNK
ncbi:MAG: hypothetical protein WBB39_02145 [Candidatus Saccharimonadales bacterium]